MAEIAPKPERVHIWIPEHDNLVGSYLPAYDPNKGIVPPTLEDIVERFDQMKGEALTQHIGRVANTGQDVMITKSYRPYISENSDQEREVVDFIRVDAKWKNIPSEVVSTQIIASNSEYDSDSGAVSIMYVMSELEDATTEGRAIFIGRV
ncbi:MAG: hypothetical protein AAB462_04045 [Patescibacteria group bacterium]